ncbi:hypothetical protein GCM10009837_64110 [Streptomyces durmitorensis]|uniref:Uncharacterized protein n=1 Tax=Streptomyces durmitorensis TaxID=319947 RepID=A0ABY4PT50_9ACTN|nr:hypothetical protein [Streptomyces durmitorensis]UQT57038.1 hypothetical protein M4V62_19085 [Streptomyces durmitorensis]
MNTPDDVPPLSEGFAVRLDLTPGWVDLTLRDGSKAEAKALATETVNRLNPLSLEIEKSAVFDDMADRAFNLNEDVPALAAAYYAESGEALVDLVIDSYGDEGVPRPSADEVLPLLLEWENGEVIGEPEVTRLELSAGPAMRVQATLKIKRMFGLGRRLTEFVKYAVFPPDMQSLVVVTATWEKIQLTEENSQRVDELLPSLSLNLVDEDGNDIAPTPPSLE